MTNRIDRDEARALKFLRGQMEDPELEPKLRQRAALAILSATRKRKPADPLAVPGLKTKRAAAAQVIASAGRFKRAAAPTAQ